MRVIVNVFIICTSHMTPVASHPLTPHPENSPPLPHSRTIQFNRMLYLTKTQLPPAAANAAHHTSPRAVGGIQSSGDRDAHSQPRLLKQNLSHSTLVCSSL